MTDDGYIVPDAVRLDQAARGLVELFQLTPITPADQLHPAYVFFDGMAPPSNEWTDHATYVAQCYLKAMAEKALEAELITCRLDVWTAEGTGDRQRDARVLFGPSQCNWSSTFSTGRYIAVQGQPAKPPSYVDARLWVKIAGWSAACRRMVGRRHPLTAELIDAGMTGNAAGPKDEGYVDRVALRLFIRRVHEVDGRLPRVAGPLTDRAKAEFAPKIVTRTMVTEAVAAEGLKRVQSRPKKVR